MEDEFATGFAASSVWVTASETSAVPVTSETSSTSVCTAVSEYILMDATWMAASVRTVWRSASTVEAMTTSAGSGVWCTT